MTTNVADNLKPPRTVDLTPTWSGLIPWMICVLETGDEEAKAPLRQELRRMAKALDEHNERVKEERDDQE